jgi:hypothetical protein
MRHGLWTHALAAALCLLAAGSAAAQQSGRVNLDRVEVTGRKGELSKWFLAESQHFAVYSDARQDDVTQLLDNLEKLDHLLRIYTLPGRPEEQQRPKLTLYYHDRLSDLRQIVDHMPVNAVGLYSSCSSGVQGFGVQLERIPRLGNLQLDKSPLNDTLSYVFEAYARHFLYRHTDIRTPASFIDGFALYFSSVRFSEQQMVVGRVPTTIGAYLGFLGEGRRYSLDYEDVLQGNLANARSYAGDAGVRLEFEAKSWLLTHYMLSSKDNRKRLNRYLVLAGAGAAPAKAFESAFGVKPADIGTVMWRYGRKGTEALRVEHPSLPAARVSYHTLSREAGEAILADAVLKSCPTREAGESLLKKLADLAARFPDDMRVRLALSRAQIEWGSPQDGLSGLGAVLQEDGASSEALYLAGMAHLRLAERSAGDARRSHLHAAQRHLQGARGQDRPSPEVALAIFQVEVAMTDAPGDDALKGAISAWQAAREVEPLGRSAALAYAYTGRGDEAYQTLDLLAQDLRDKTTAEWARMWRSRLEAGVTRGDILAEMRRHRASDASLKEWTLDKESAMQQVKLGHGQEAAQSFIQQQQQAQQSKAMQPTPPLGDRSSPR